MIRGLVASLLLVAAAALAWVGAGELGLGAVGFVTVLGGLGYLLGQRSVISARAERETERAQRAVARAHRPTITREIALEAQAAAAHGRAQVEQQQRART